MTELLIMRDKEFKTVFKIYSNIEKKESFFSLLDLS